MNLITRTNRAKAILGNGFAVASLMLISGLAMAQETFDTATITTKITTFAGYALVILFAFAAAIWGLRAAGLVGRGK